MEKRFRPKRRYLSATLLEIIRQKKWLLSGDDLFHVFVYNNREISPIKAAEKGPLTTALLFMLPPDESFAYSCHTVKFELVKKHSTFLVKQL